MKERFREAVYLEERIKYLLYRVPSQKPLSDEHLDQLNRLPLGERMEMAETVRIVLGNLQSHVADLQVILQVLESLPKLRAVKPTEHSGVSLLNDLQPRDIISIWEHPRREYFYVIGVVLEPEASIVCMRLRRDLKLDGRVLKGYSTWSHKIGLPKLELARLEKRNVFPQDVGASQNLIGQWLSLGYNV